ncbi:MAG: hypothetical protein E6J89_07705 [Deltaproteobacteria bacterium]|nr:MAG: hypothetical protein E6J89_07705 [Deltaproteobacteria bacterium]
MCPAYHLSSRLPVLALVGRPNVGKSTLFNRLSGKRKAIVDDLPGVTRDRNYGEAEWDRAASNRTRKQGSSDRFKNRVA